MKFTLFISVFLFFIIGATAQNFSNKGKEFWLVFPPHQPSNIGSISNPIPGNANLSVYISSDKDSKGKIYINGRIFIEFQVVANVTREYILDRSLTYISTLESANNFNPNLVVRNKGIQIVVDEGYPPVVVYSHFYASARSAASIVLPANVLQTKYLVMCFDQISQSSAFDEPARSQFSVISTQDNTRLKITLRKNKVIQGVEYIDLQKGEIYQYQAREDLTGTEIESISTSNTSSCNKIAVFSGSSATIIDWPNTIVNVDSRDPLFQQCYPENSWGKNYIITDFSGKQKLFFRILAKEDGTEVILPNSPPIILNRGEYYQGNSSMITPPFELKSNKPVSVAQYTVSQEYEGLSQGIRGDPEMLILNSVEQSIDNVTVFLSSKENIRDQFVNVVIRDEGINDFLINNISYSSEFIKIPNTDYSYLKKSFVVPFNSFFSLNMKAKIGFNAFCYGFGTYESYSYSAGTNVKDLYQTVSINNTEAIIPFTRTCVNTPFNFSVTLPYKPVIMKWDFSSNNQLVYSNGQIVPSITLSNGGLDIIPNDSAISSNDPNVMLYTYKLNQTFLVKSKFDIPYKITTISSSTDGCTGEQIIENIIEVKDPPITTLDIVSDGCINSPINFKATDVLDEGVDVNFYRWYQDGQVITGETQFELNRSFTTEGSRDISVEMISKIGCISERVTKTVSLSLLPKVDFIEDAIRCIGKSFTVTNKSEKVGNSSIIEGYWAINGVKQTTQSTIENLIYSTNLPEIRLKYTAKTNTGCIDSTEEKLILINPNPTLNLILPEICLTDGVAEFKANTSIIPPDIVSKVQWDFGDALLNPNTNLVDGETVSHLFSATGAYQMKVKSISNNKCITQKDTLFFVNGSNPNANFSFLNSTLCSNKEIQIKNNSNVFPGKITKVELVWRLQDGTIISQLDNEPDTNLIYKKQFDDFTDESKLLDVKLIAYSGVTCKAEYNSPSTPIYGSGKVKIGDLGEVCTGYPAIVLPPPTITNVTNTSGNGQYFGSFISNGNLPNQFVFTPPKSGVKSSVYFSYITSKGCETLDTAIITFNPTPIVNAGSDLQLLQDSSIRINATANNGINMKYRWTPSLYLDNPSILQPQIIKPQSDVTYVLTATGKGNCIARDTVLLTSLNILIPPNTLVPGRPPYDKWVIDNIHKYKGCILKIFDINGRLVKSYDNGYDNNFPWNGTRDKTGEFLPAGTYYYVLDPKNGRKIQTGYVTIHR